jgi:hypothetical protein
MSSELPESHMAVTFGTSGDASRVFKQGDVCHGYRDLRLPVVALMEQGA